MWEIPVDGTIEIEDNTHVVCYVALNGHGFYNEPGTWVRIVGFANDECDEGVRWQPRAVVVSDSPDSRLGAVTPDWDKRAALGVVLAAEGYPASARKGDAISGLDGDTPPATKVFHAGTRVGDDGSALTDGGRVLCACALGADIAEAKARAYDVVNVIDWPGMQYRRDIGWRALR